MNVELVKIIVYIIGALISYVVVLRLQKNYSVFGKSEDLWSDVFMCVMASVFWPVTLPIILGIWYMKK